MGVDDCIADYLCLVTATTTRSSSMEIQLATEYIANSLHKVIRREDYNFEAGPKLGCSVYYSGA